MENKFESGKDNNHLANNNFEKVLPEKKVKKKIMKDAEGERAKVVELAEKWLNENKDFHEMPLADQQAIIKYFDLQEQSDQYIYIKNLDLPDQGKLTIADFLNDLSTHKRMRLMITVEKNMHQLKRQDLGKEKNLSLGYMDDFRHYLAKVESPENDERVINCFAELFLSQSLSEACRELGISKIKSKVTTANRDNFSAEDLEIVLDRNSIFVDLTMSKSQKTFNEKEEKLYGYQLNKLRNKQEPDVVAVFAPLLSQSNSDDWEKSVQWYIRNKAKGQNKENDSYLQPKEILSQLTNYLNDYFSDEKKLINTAVSSGRVEVIKRSLRDIKNRLQFDKNSQ